MKIENVKDLIDKSVSWELQIPEFQREYVWDNEQVKLLVDSLYRNYTINSILIWEWWNELARRDVWWAINDIKFPENDNKIITYLLDQEEIITSYSKNYSIRVLKYIEFTILNIIYIKYIYKEYIADDYKKYITPILYHDKILYNELYMYIELYYKTRFIWIQKIMEIINYKS